MAGGVGDTYLAGLAFPTASKLYVIYIPHQRVNQFNQTWVDR